MELFAAWSKSPEERQRGREVERGPCSQEIDDSILVLLQLDQVMKHLLCCSCVYLTRLGRRYVRQIR